MTHVVDGKVESKCNRAEAFASGLIGSKVASEFIWSQYLGRDFWKTIDDDTLKKIKKH